MSEKDDYTGGSRHWKDQDECQDCGRSDVPLRAIKMVNLPRQMLCQDCFETALEVGEVDPTDPRIDGGARYA